MNDTIDLNGKIKLAINGAFERGYPLTIGYIDEAGKPSISIRGSVQVLNSTEVGLWAREREKGLAKVIEKNPYIALLFYGHLPDGSKMRAHLTGRAHADSARNAEVYDTMGEAEQQRDPEAKGVAIFVEVEKVSGMSVDGPFSQSR
jgi:hypothetical protein